MNKTALAAAIEFSLSPDSEIYKLAQDSTAKAPPDLREILFLHSLANPVEEILKSDTPFEGGGGFLVANDNGYTGFHSGEAARSLLERVRNGESAIGAIEWLENVVNTPRAAAYRALALWGVEIDSAVPIGFDMTLLPYDELPSSRTKEWISRRRDPSAYPGFFSAMFMFPPKAAILRRCEISPVFFKTGNEEPAAKADPLQNQRILEDAMLALTLVGPCCPVPAGSWFAFEDPDVQATAIYGGVSSSNLEIVPWGFELPKLLEAARAGAVASKFLTTDEPLRSSLRLALRRLNQAMRRPPHGDRALDLAISLESLLSDEPGDNTFKVSLRAALLTPGAKQERLKVRSTIRALYSIRSALAHDGVVPKEMKVRGHRKQPSTEVVLASTKICASVLVSILMRGNTPDWYEFEVVGDES